MTTKTLELRITIVYTPPDDVGDGEVETYPSEEAFRRASGWLYEEIVERIPVEMKCSLVCAVKKGSHP